MYSFEGEFRRKPEQNYAGASIHEPVNNLIQRARYEREKREEARREQQRIIKVQSCVRSYLTRKKIKHCYRILFDNHVSELKKTQPSEQLLSDLVKIFVFFYSKEFDSQRLLWLSQHILRNSSSLLKSSLDKNNSWYWHIKWILSLNIDLLNSTNLESFATSLRIIEELTSIESYKNLLGSDNAQVALRDLFQYLVKKCYFDSLRKILDTKIPTLFDVEDTPAPPLARSILEFVKRPFSVRSLTFLDEYTSTVMDHFVRTFLKGPITDINHKFILPNLSQEQNTIDYVGPDFKQLVIFLTNSPIQYQPNTNLFYSLLILEPYFDKYSFVIKCLKTGREVNAINNYLDILSSLTSCLAEPPVIDYLNKAWKHSSANQEDSSEDESDEEEKPFCGYLEHELQILKMCSDLLNESFRVNRIVDSIGESCSSSSIQFLLEPVCKLCHYLLMSHKLAVHKYRLLYTLALKAEFLQNLWKTILTTEQQSFFGPSLVTTSLVTVISRGTNLASGDFDRIVPLLATFCSLFSSLISTLHDAEFNKAVRKNSEEGTQNPLKFTAADLISITAILKDVALGLIELAYPDTRPTIITTKCNNRNTQTSIWSHLLRVTVVLLRQLHSRDLRCRFCPEGHWVSNRLTMNSAYDKPSNMQFVQYSRRSRLNYRPFRGIPVISMDNLDEGPPLTTRQVRILTVLREIPFVLPFEERVVVFQGLLLNDKMQYQNTDAHFMAGPNIHITIRRNYLYEDAFEKLSIENEPEIRQTLRVHMKSAAGLDEAGVDGGGLLREFLSELLKTAFDPNRGFFRMTNDNMLYPNPYVHLIQQNFAAHYFFIGRMLGKALYENLLVELPLAEFFLSKIIGRQTEVDVHHLASLDPLMYRNLLSLKNYDGDVVDLGLDFTIVIDEFGQTRVEDLKPNGANITVTNQNRIEYIHLMADYKLNVQIRKQCYFFKQGLANVIPLDWLHMFSNHEVQVLISGAEVPVDIEDLKLHTNYVGGYTPEDPTIHLFWSVVNDFTDEQKTKLLKFVTSCSRPPLLGFKRCGRVVNAAVYDAHCLGFESRSRAALFVEQEISSVIGVATPLSGDELTTRPRV
ncbi:ubiquitin-protein ligase E3C isoform X2 [Daktulosphaira vitifoliae]|uniref:ubiquitin-protein ligase E3C isoform X2 n=1 Tax=Daktulosphaira vitifoliae TaxID=58002 RepID=UPI0021A9E45F|nr:ubiquitin-protein ligase E3C isoform X2 [Daktulosphaira vitifoliae]